MLFKKFHALSAGLIAMTLTLAFTACNGPGANNLDAGGAQSPEMSGLPGISGPATPPVSRPARSYATDVLLYEGAGTWATETASFESLLTQAGISYKVAQTTDLENMTVDQLASYGMILMPGGSGGTEASSLSAAAHARLREAVQMRGLGYLGFCAGAFVAVAPAPAAGQDVDYGFGVVAGPDLGYYYLESTTDQAMTLETFPDGSTRDMLWYGGPVVPNVPGGVVAKYPDGNPAISEMWSGNGFVILSGPHPAAPLSVAQGFGFTDTDGFDGAYAVQLVQATLHQQALPAF